MAMMTASLLDGILPEDDYDFRCFATEAGASPSGTVFVKLCLEVLTGDHKGRLAFLYYAPAARMWREWAKRWDMPLRDEDLQAPVGRKLRGRIDHRGGYAFPTLIESA